MKKIINKITFISIILIFILSAKAFASSSFRIMFQDGNGAKEGEIIEIPIIIDSINIEGAEENIYYFTANLEIDEDALELVAYDNDEYIKVNEELKDYGLEISYNAEEQKIKTGFSQQLINKLSDEDDSSNIKALNNYLEIGTIKLKVKDGVEPDSYLIGITNIEGGNSEIYLDANDGYSFVKVYEDEEEQEEVADKGEDESKSETIVVEDEKKKLILTIEVSEDKKLITLAPDEVNGAVVKTIKNKDTELAKENGVFVFESEPNKIYEFMIYGLDDGLLGNEYVSTIIEAEEKETTPEDKKDSGKKNEEKSPQTGDEIYVISAILLTALGTLCISIRKK